jgi:hypothetical protein
MAEHFKVAGYDGFVEFMKNLKSGSKIVNVYFSGAKDENVSGFLKKKFRHFSI